MKNFTEILKPGSKGNEVVQLQLKLIELGFQNVYVKGILKELKADGDFGAITQNALSNFQAKVIAIASDIYIQDHIKTNYKIEVNGEMNFPTWWVLRNYNALAKWYAKEVKPDPIIIPPVTTSESATRVEFLKLCKELIGVKEDPKRNNFGKEVERIQKVGSCNVVSGGSPWCQFAKNERIKKTLEVLNISTSGKLIEEIWCNGYTPSWVNFSRKHKVGINNPKRSDIIPGQLGFVYSSARKNAQHVYAITGFNSAGSLITLEGNTNGGGSAEGDGYYQRTRPLNSVHCFHVVNWWQLLKKGS